MRTTLLALLLVVCATAQQIIVHNPTKEARRLVQARVSQAVGQVRDSDGAVVAFACEPIHDHYRLEFIADLPAFAARTFTATPTAVATVVLTAPTRGPPEALASSLILVGGHPLDFTRARVVQHSPLRSITRVPVTAPGLGGWVDFEWIPGASGALPFHVWLIARPNDGSTFVDLPAIAFETFTRTAPVWDHARRKGLTMVFGPGDYTRTTLASAGRWGRFQGQLFHGHLGFGPGADWLVDVPLHGSQLDVVVDGTRLYAGPQPSAAALSIYLGGIRNEIAQSQGRPWSPPEPFGLRATPGGTGGQPDFGERKLFWFPGFPRGTMRMASECISQELCRGVWHLEADGLTRVVAGAHPTWRTWDSTTHWNEGISPDRLQCRGPWADWHSTGGFWGWDHQHLSLNFLTDYAEITAEYWALELIDWLCDTWLASLNDQAPRATGRQLYAMTRAWQLLGREDVRSLLIARARAHPVTIGSGQACFGLIGPDARNLLVLQSMCWQDGMCGMGLAYCAEVFNLADVRDKAWEVGRVWLQNAWRDTGYSNGNLEVLKAMAWNGGVKLTDAEYQQNKSTTVPILDALIEDSRGTAFTEWNIAFVRWLLLEARKRGDTVTEQRAQLIIDQHRPAADAPVSTLAWWQLWAA